MRVIISLNDASQNNSDISFIELEGEAVEIIEVLQSESLPIPKMKEAVESGGDAAITTLISLGYTYDGGQMWKPPLGQPSEFVKDGTESSGGNPHGSNPYINFKFEDVEVGDRLLQNGKYSYTIHAIDIDDESFCSAMGRWMWYNHLCDGKHSKVTLEKKKK